MIDRRAAALIVACATIVTGGCQDTRALAELEATRKELRDSETARESADVELEKARLALANCETAARIRELSEPLPAPPRKQLLGLDCLSYFTLAETCGPKLPAQLRTLVEGAVGAQKKNVKEKGNSTSSDAVCRAARLSLEALEPCAPPPCACPDPKDPLCPCGEDKP